MHSQPKKGRSCLLPAGISLPRLCFIDPPKTSLLPHKYFSRPCEAVPVHWNWHHRALSMSWKLPYSSSHSTPYHAAHSAGFLSDHVFWPLKSPACTYTSFKMKTEALALLRQVNVPCWQRWRGVGGAGGVLERREKEKEVCHWVGNVD